jgi:hypothetical protein
MQLPANPPAKPPSLWWKKLGWRKWLLFILFPIPIGSWWQTTIWAILFCVLAWLLLKNSMKRAVVLAKQI